MTDLVTHVQTLADNLNAPLVVLDSSFTPVAYSTHQHLAHDPEQIHIILSQGGRLNLRKRLEEHVFEDTSAPQLVPPGQGTLAHIIMELHQHGSPIGLLMMPALHPENPLPSEVSNNLKAAQEDISRALHQHALGDPSSTAFMRQIVGELLSEDLSQRVAAQSKIISSKLLSALGSFTAVIIRTAQDDAALSTVDETLSARRRSPLQSLMRRIVERTNCLAAIVDDEAVLIIPRELNDETLRDYTAHHRAHRFWITAGNAVGKLSEVYHSWRQARLTMTSLHRQPDSLTVGTWGDLGIYRLLVQLPLDTLELDDLPDSVQRLITDGNPRLAETVQAYLESGGKAAVTARALHIHRSTLYYRLERAADVCGVNLQDSSAQHEMLWGLRVARLAHIHYEPSH